MTAVLALLAVLYLNVALSVSVPFLIVGNFASMQYGSPSLELAEDKLDRSENDDGGPICWTVSNRIRGALEPQVGFDKVFGFISSLGIPGLPLEDVNANRWSPLPESSPRGDALPQELLRRPPPVG